MLRAAQRLMTRLITRSFKNSSTESLVVISGCLPADLAALDLASKRYLALKSHTFAPSAAAYIRTALPKINWSSNFDPPKRHFSAHEPPWMDKKMRVNLDKKSTPSLTPSHTDTLYVSTDSSKTRRGVVCSYVITSQPQPLFADHFTLPSYTSATQAEQVAILLSLQKMLKEYPSTVPTVHVFSDDKLTLTNLTCMKKTPSLIREILSLMPKFPNITFNWIEKRTDSMSNDYADFLARLAAHRIATALPTDIVVLRSIAAEKPIIRKEVLDLWEAEWTESTDKNINCKQFFPKPGNARVLRRSMITYELTQVLTGHCRLNFYLHKINRKSSPRCACGATEETVTHFVFECTNHANHRMDFQALCVAEFHRYPPQLSDIASNVNIWKSFVTFITSTKRLSCAK